MPKVTTNSSLRFARVGVGVVCGVYRTDLHIIDGELTDPKQPFITRIPRL